MNTGHKHSIVSMVAQATHPKLPGLGNTEPVHMVTAPKDKKVYRRITLGNGLRVILISDPEMADQVSGGSESDIEMPEKQAGADSNDEGDDEDDEDSDEEV